MSKTKLSESAWKDGFSHINAEDREKLLKWAGAPGEVAHDKCLHELIARQAAINPLNVALEDSSQTVTYRELQERSTHLALFLNQNDVRTGDIVGICQGRTCEAIISMLGILKAGAAYLPLDPKSPPDRLRFMIEDSHCSLILTDPTHTAHIPPCPAQCIAMPLEETLVAHGDASCRATVSPEDLAYVIYTSGSTGRPKGVLIEHRSVVNYVTELGPMYCLQPGDRYLQFSSFSFDASVEEIFTPLSRGATLVLRTDEMSQSSQIFFESCARLKINAVSLPTAFCHELATCLESQSVQWPAGLRVIVFGGERALPHQMKLLRKAAGPDVRLINCYGPTETTIGATLFELPAEISETEPVPIGRPVGNLQAYVLDSDLRGVAVGVPGELCIGGVGVARGYLNRPELTAEKFVYLPGSEERIYRTGDLVAWQADGNLHYVGRVDDQVKIRGFRIELGEIEAALNAYSEISQGVVTVHTADNGNKTLVAYFISARSLSSVELKAFLKEKIPDYMVPLHFIQLERFPTTISGKIDRKALPEPAKFFPDASAAAPLQDALELQIRLAFERVLRCANPDTTVSFFELGGDSLKALQLIIELELATGMKLPMGLLYETSTVRGLAEHLRRDQPKSRGSCLVTLQPQGNNLPLFLIHTTPGDILGYGSLVYHLGPQQPCYGLQSLGLEQIDQAHRTIPEMARHYVNELRSVQPEGPYYLCGWCYGGIVAFEMAQILKGENEQVALLALIDTPAVAPGRNVPLYYFRKIQRLVSMSPARWWKYLHYKVRYYRTFEAENNKRYKKIVVTTGKNSEVVEQQNALLKKLEQLYTLNMNALNTYRSQPYAGRIALFNAAEQDPAKLPDPLYGWSGLAKEIETSVLPGDHDGILSEPNVQSLAQQLKRSLLRSRPVRALVLTIAGWKAQLEDWFCKFEGQFAAVECELADWSFVMVLC